MSGAFDAVTLGWAFSTLLFFLSLWSPRAVPVARHRHAATAGVLILMGATLYAADVVNMPEILGTLVMGSAIGLLLGRELPRRTLPSLLTVLAAMVGLAAIAIALAVWLNPYAFGLKDAMSDRIGPGDALALALGILTGAMACVGAALAVIVRRVQPFNAAFPPLVPLAWAGAMAGWSVSASSFLLENIALAVAGGLAGSCGSIMAIRLSYHASGKGLADAQRHP